MNKKARYYKDLVCKKIDQSTEAFAQRIEAIHRGNWERVEYLDRMVLEPLDRQIHYLAVKLHRAVGGRDL